jgi:hypothetical protein
VIARLMCQRSPTVSLLSALAVVRGAVAGSTDAWADRLNGTTSRASSSNRVLEYSWDLRPFQLPPYGYCLLEPPIGTQSKLSRELGRATDMGTYAFKLNRGRGLFLPYQ